MKRILLASLVLNSIALLPTAHGGTFDITKIQHVVVIYQENWSYDGLYANFPETDPDPKIGSWPIGKTVVQKDIDDVEIKYLPQALNKDDLLEAHFPYIQPVKLFDMKPYVPTTAVTGDIVHRFYTEQLQICGNMSHFVAWSDNPGLVLGAFDASDLPEGKLAKQYVMCDNCFHSAFGGSFLNHQFFISAQAPVWPNALTAGKASELLAHAGAPRFINQALLETAPAGSNLLPVPTPSKAGKVAFKKAKDEDEESLLQSGKPDPDATVFTRNVNWPMPFTKGAAPFDNDLTIDPTPKDGKAYYAVNTVQSSSWPFKVGGPYLPLLKNATIGDLLSCANITWKWYSGGWDQAVAGNPDPNFQFHHQPFNYYVKYAPGKPGRAHLVDLNRFAADLASDSLPAVSFVKFQGELNEHPGYADVASGQQATADLVNQIQKSSAWAHTLIIITYDENGGRWDHVTPPVIDKWGPGTRVPMILISPFVKRGYVDHTQYETVSILRFIEDRWKLPSLGSRDAKASSFGAAFDPAM